MVWRLWRTPASHIGSDIERQAKFGKQVAVKGGTDFGDTSAQSRVKKQCAHGLFPTHMHPGELASRRAGVVRAPGQRHDALARGRACSRRRSRGRARPPPLGACRARAPPRRAACSARAARAKRRAEWAPRRPNGRDAGETGKETGRR
eukprot:6191182-Pleurochrysis_carterae.AAC.1